MKRGFIGILTVLVMMLVLIGGCGGGAGPVLEVRALATTTLLTATGSDTWLVPAGVTSITVEAWGAGGAGGGSTGGGDKTGGGGGGAYATKSFSGLTPLSTISYYVALGGTGTHGDGTAGGATWFLANNASGLVAVGGLGGSSTAHGGAGGAGGNASLCFGDTVYGGGNGANAGSGSGGGGGGAGSTGPGQSATGGSGGGGTAEHGGVGGDAASSGSGDSGSLYGGGGGGAKGNFVGGAGAQGLIRITYTITPVATTLGLSPGTGSNPVGTTHNLTATVRDQSGAVMSGVGVTWNITGAGHFSGTPDSSTDGSGEARAVITSVVPGTSTVRCEVTSNTSVNSTATKEWTSAPDPEGMTLELLPVSGSNPVGTTHNLTATVRDQSDAVMSGVGVTWNITGVGSFSATESATDVNGEAHATITSVVPGTSTVRCEVTSNTSVYDTATKVWSADGPGPIAPDWSRFSDPIVWHILMVQSTEGGTVAANPRGNFPYGGSKGFFTYYPDTVVNLTAVPDSGYRFAGWTGAPDIIGDVSAASTYIALNRDCCITAHFAEITEAGQYNLTISSTSGGSVTVPGEGTFSYNAGQVLDLVAKADSGYKFVKWTGDVATVASANGAPTTITMNGDYSIVGSFA